MAASGATSTSGRSRARMPTRYYLQAGGGLSTETPTAGNRCNESAIRSSQSRCRQSAAIFLPATTSCLQGAWDQRGGPHVWNSQEPIPLSARNDVLVFQSDPLADNVEVTGELVVNLWISSTAPDTDFTAKLVDVYPASAGLPGRLRSEHRRWNLRARFRESLAAKR